MNIKNLFSYAVISISALTVSAPLTGCAQKSEKQTSAADIQSSKERKGGKPGGGPVIDKSGDATLQAMIKSEVPQFKQFEYTDATTGKTMQYTLFTPKNIDESKKYPLVLFMADASTPGTDVTRPLTQGYGALVWATDEWQAQHPCYVLVPQYSGVAINDAYGHTDEVDMVARLVKQVASQQQVDNDRLYTTGQSMGGMISMYYNSAYPDLFAASIFVDCHWDSATFPELVKHKFVFKCDRFLKPTSKHISDTFLPPLCISTHAASNRRRISHFCGVRLLIFLKSRLNVARLLPV